MARIILVSGKGGVGKTTVAAATALGCAERGHKTLVVSFDLAHSLADAFDIGGPLIGRRDGKPYQLSDHLDVQEIDVYAELEREWAPVYKYAAGLMSHGGLNTVLAEELAVLPGMEDLVALLTLDRYLAEGRYDVIVLDCPPTGETLRFIGLASSLEWYARRRLPKERRLVGLIRPIAAMFSNSALYLPEDSFFESIQGIVNRMRGIDNLLRTPAVCSVRLVLNPEKMVMRESQRAYMYFGMYGVNTDFVAINRLLPTNEPQFAHWAKAQAEQVEKARSHFTGTPMTTVPLFPWEVIGVDRLRPMYQALYADADPAAVLASRMPVRFVSDPDGSCRLEVTMPFAERGNLDLTRDGEDLTLRVGTFTRRVQLPRSVAMHRTGPATLQDGTLTIRFEKPLG